jgi:hypothetical protein
MMPLKMIGAPDPRQLSPRDNRDSLVSEFGGSRATGATTGHCQGDVVHAESAARFVLTLVEPTRLRVLNSGADAP